MPPASATGGEIAPLAATISAIKNNTLRSTAASLGMKEVGTPEIGAAQHASRLFEHTFDGPSSRYSAEACDLRADIRVKESVTNCNQLLRTIVDRLPPSRHLLLIYVRSRSLLRAFRPSRRVCLDPALLNVCPCPVPGIRRNLGFSSFRSTLLR
jgi:hypothetical protein